MASTQAEPPDHGQPHSAIPGSPLSELSAVPSDMLSPPFDLITFPSSSSAPSDASSPLSGVPTDLSSPRSDIQNDVSSPRSDTPIDASSPLSEIPSDFSSPLSEIPSPRTPPSWPSPSPASPPSPPSSYDPEHLFLAEDFEQETPKYEAMRAVVSQPSAHPTLGNIYETAMLSTASQNNRTIASLIFALLDALLPSQRDLFHNQMECMARVGLEPTAELDVPFTNTPFACEPCKLGFPTVNDFVRHLHERHFIGPTTACSCDLCNAIWGDDDGAARDAITRFYYAWPDADFVLWHNLAGELHTSLSPLPERHGRKTVEFGRRTDVELRLDAALKALWRVVVAGASQPRGEVVVPDIVVNGNTEGAQQQQQEAKISWHKARPAVADPRWRDRFF